MKRRPPKRWWYVAMEDGTTFAVRCRYMIEALREAWTVGDTKKYTLPTRGRRFRLESNPSDSTGGGSNGSTQGS